MPSGYASTSLSRTTELPRARGVTPTPSGQSVAMEEHIMSDEQPTTAQYLGSLRRELATEGIDPGVADRLVILAFEHLVNNDELAVRNA